jgi:hypothetical protein
VNIAIVRNTFDDRAVFFKVSKDYQDAAFFSDQFDNFVFADPHPERGISFEYDHVIPADWKRINFEYNVGVFSWYKSLRHVFENYDYDHLITIEDDVILSRDYFKMCLAVVNSGVLEKDVLFFHPGAWQKPDGDPNLIVRSSSSIRSTLIRRENFFKYVDAFYREATTVSGGDLDVQKILDSSNITSISPKRNRHGHIGVYGWSSSGIYADNRGQSAIFSSRPSFYEFYSVMRESCQNGQALLNLNGGKNSGYFWDFDPDMDFDRLEFEFEF